MGSILTQVNVIFNNDNNLAKIILINQKYKSDRFTDEIIDQVKNVGNGTVEFVKVSFNLFNKKGDLIGTDYTCAEQDTLKPERKSPFNITQIKIRIIK